MINSLKNRSAIITGASQGLGKAIAKAYVEAGASIYICARNGEKLHETKTELMQFAGSGQKIIAATADVSRPGQSAKLASDAVTAFGHIDILVNNAGVYGPAGLLEDIDWDAWVRAIEINLYGTLLMCRAVLKHMKANGYGKIINLSGGGATNPMPRLSAYAASKAAVVRMTETLALEVSDYHIDVNAIAPGALNTRLLDEVIAAGPEKVGQDFYNRMLKIKEEGGTPLEKGAELCVYLGASESDGVTGKLISAVWDPWHEFSRHMEDLKETDIFTLRRIIPRDRGKKWD